MPSVKKGKTSGSTASDTHLVCYNERVWSTTISRQFLNDIKYYGWDSVGDLLSKIGVKRMFAHFITICVSSVSHFKQLNLMVTINTNVFITYVYMYNTCVFITYVLSLLTRLVNLNHVKHS